MASISQQLKSCDESYLLSISNKGILNRARRELSESGISVEIAEERFSAVFSDGTTVLFSGKLSQYDCSCPSRSVCKHVVMALIKASEEVWTSENAAASGDVKASEDKKASEDNKAPADKRPIQDASGEGAWSFGKEAYGYILKETPEKLQKAFGKKTYSDALSIVQSGDPAVFEEGANLRIRVGEAFTATFLPYSDIKDSLCTCKAKTCRHRLEAILHYLSREGSWASLTPLEKEPEAPLDEIPGIMSFVEEIFMAGLMHLPSGFADACESYASVFHGAGFADLERLFQSSRKELMHFEQKSAMFDKGMLLSNLTRIYVSCNALLRGKTGNYGKFKRQYSELPKLEAFGLGAYPWHAKSGFAGVTALFAIPQMKRIFTLSHSLPASEEQEASTMIAGFWRDASALGVLSSFESLSTSRVEIKSAKASIDGRLSKSRATSASIISQSSIDSEELKPWILDNFTSLTKFFSAEQADYGESLHLIIRIKGFVEIGFNKITQIYSAKILDDDGSSLNLMIPYSKINENAIMYFEKLKDEIPEYMTARVDIPKEGRELSIFPIAAWTGGNIENVSKQQFSPHSVDYSKFFMPN
ncbi:MAG: SWIM zinc finger family protein [Clostridiales bacterium]|jgi:hypothetical protein|nr:SWIM zinc finger family protein [Clostridiales bacterium]